MWFFLKFKNQKFLAIFYFLQTFFKLFFRLKFKCLKIVVCLLNSYFCSFLTCHFTSNYVYFNMFPRRSRRSRNRKSKKKRNTDDNSSGSASNSIKSQNSEDDDIDLRNNSSNTNNTTLNSNIYTYFLKIQILKFSSYISDFLTIFIFLCYILYRFSNSNNYTFNSFINTNNFFFT